MWANMRGISSASCGSTEPPATTVTCNGQHLFCAIFIQLDHFGNLGEKSSLPGWFAFLCHGRAHDEEAEPRRAEPLLLGDGSRAGAGPFMAMRDQRAGGLWSCCCTD